MSNNNNGNNLLLILFRTAIGILVLVSGAWATWVTNSINKHSDILTDIKTSLARIEQKLTDHFAEDAAHGRH